MLSDVAPYALGCHLAQEYHLTNPPNRWGELRDG